MSRCSICQKQSNHFQHQKYYFSPNQDYFTIQTIIQTPCHKELLRRKQKSIKYSKSKQRKKQTPPDRKHNKRERSKSSRSISSNNNRDPRSIGTIKQKINNYQQQLEDLKYANQQLRNQLAQIRSKSQTRTPFYPMQQSKSHASFGKIVRDKLLSMRSGKISLGSSKPTVEEMDELLIASSHGTNQSQSENELEESQYPDQYLHPTHKFTELMLKLQKPTSQSEQRMIRNEALRVAGKIRQSKHQSERLHQGLYYS